MSTLKFKKVQHLDHILMRPDTYVGSLRMKASDEYIVVSSEEETSIVRKKITFSPGLLRIFIEALSNAIDNVQRSKEAGVKCTKIKISLDRETLEGCIVKPEKVEDLRKYLPQDSQ